MRTPLLAHSQRDGKPSQTYVKHVTNVLHKAACNALNATMFYSGNSNRDEFIKEFIDWVAAAAVYHDLGKLDDANQVVLGTNSQTPLPIAHDDAGVAELDKLNRKEAAILAHAHHRGLFSRDEEFSKQGCPFRELKKRTPKGEKIADHVDRELSRYEELHDSTGSSRLIKSSTSGPIHGCGFTRRIALSCLVDADHGDTARYYENEVETSSVEPRWQERIAALESYVQGLPDGQTNREQKRNILRKRMFAVCRNAPIEPPIRTCDAPVGSGKTTAVIAHLLRVAAEKTPQLRHIIIVLPYTNIITQSVEIYRNALVLKGERPEDIVAEHHHCADFEDVNLRQLATLWKAPIIVTTAVQFFETLGSHNPARLRKLHELPGSAVFVDEMHAAMPSHLWPQMWRWLEAWTQDWGGHLVLASGSLPRFWELEEYKTLIYGNTGKSFYEVPDLVKDESLRTALKKTEEQRVIYRRRPDNADALDCQGLINFVVRAEPGPRLLIVNTVQTAAVIARVMRESGHDVLHLSTALAPAHRNLIVERIKLRLREKLHSWTLVATSCVEAGMNFSFRTGFRERASTASLIQIGGRISRGDEFIDAEIWDLLLRDDQFSRNPAVTISSCGLDHFTLNELNTMHPSRLSTIAMKREWTCGAQEKARRLIVDEDKMEYPSVANQCRVIDADTRTVIIDESLAETLRRGEKVSRQELMLYSVQIWANKIKKLALQPVIHDGHSGDSQIYVWQYDYDPDFLGYMKGVMKLDDFITAGGTVI